MDCGSPDEIEYISVPIPQRKARRRNRPRRREPRRVESPIPREEKSPPPRLRPARRKRSFGSFLQATAIALAVNLLLVVLLSLIALQRKDGDESPMLSVRSIPSLPPETSPDSSSSPSRSSAAPSPVSRQTRPVTTADSLSHLALPAPSFTMEADFSGALLPLDSDTGTGLLGSGMGTTLGDSLRGRGISDGSNMVLYLDVSGSMRKHSERVSELIKSAFPKALIAEIRGCAIRPDAGFVSLLALDGTNRKKVFFVCDLQDKQTPEGLARLRELLLIRKDSRELHLLSFDRSPSLALDAVIRETSGSVILMAKSSGKGPLRVRC